MKKRDPFFDNAKILLMVLVVLGHVLYIGFPNKTDIAAFEWIFSFHMPLFVFISGYFTKISSNRKYWKSILSFVETYIVFSFILMAISCVQGNSINLFSDLITPRFSLWYLLSLIWWRMMLYFTPSSLRDNQKMLIIFSIILCLLLGWVPVDGQFSFQRTFSFFPFFITGYVAGRKQINIENVKSDKVRQFSIIVLLVVAMIYYIIPISFVVPLFQHLSYLHSSYSPFFYFGFRIGWLFIASLMSFCFLSLVPRKEYRWTHFGQLTLFIYMYHAVILSWRFYLRDIFNLPTSFFHCVIYTIIILIIIGLMSKVKFFHWLLNPISSLFKKRKI